MNEWMNEWAGFWKKDYYFFRICCCRCCCWLTPSITYPAAILNDLFSPFSSKPSDAFAKLNDLFSPSLFENFVSLRISLGNYYCILGGFFWSGKLTLLQSILECTFRTLHKTLGSRKHFSPKGGIIAQHDSVEFVFGLFRCSHEAFLLCVVFVDFLIIFYFFLFFFNWFTLIKS